MAERKILAWHFVGEDRQLRYGSNLGVFPGYIYSEPGKTELCQRGMHASIRAIDALEYAPGPIICRVRLWGDVKRGEDKIVAQHREVLWMADASRELRLFACWCARQNIALLKDKRSRDAIEVAERYANGQATNEELDAAREAARVAAWGAARDAARDAAWVAAREAAWVAARVAAWVAARVAAREAARSEQSAELERRMVGLEDYSG